MTVITNIETLNQDLQDFLDSFETSVQDPNEVNELSVAIEQFKTDLDEDPSGFGNDLSETFELLETLNNQFIYDNGAEYETLYPQGSKLMLWPMDYPRISSKGKVPRSVSKKLMAIAEELESQVQLTA